MTPLRRFGGLAYLARCPTSTSANGQAEAAAAQSYEVLGTRIWPKPTLPALGSTSSQLRHKSTTSHDKSTTSHDKSTTSHDKSTTSHDASSCSESHHDSACPLMGDSATGCPAEASASAPASFPSAHLPSPTSADSVDPLLSYTVTAHSSLEDSLGLVLDPVQLGVQLWEGVHAASGLPWWAAIPATTLAVRGLLLPLSLRAHAASSNIALLHQAFGLSGQVSAAVSATQQKQDERQQWRQGQEEQQQHAVEGGEGRKPEEAASSSGSGSSGSSGGGDKGEMSGRSLGRVELVRRVLAHLRAEHRAPAFGWYVANAAVQVPLALTLTMSLRRMCDSLWPGLTSEGLLYFQDLTAPPMYLSTLSTPYGTAGTILPLALVLLYVNAADRSAGATSPGINTALKLLVLPLYCAALAQPHAVLLHWLSLAATHMGMYELAARLPAARRAAGVPEGELPPAGAVTKDDNGERGAVPLDGLLLALSDSYEQAGNKAAARTCLAALLARQPDHPTARERLRTLGAPPS